MKNRLHAVAGVCAFALVASFWASTVVSELFLSRQAVIEVKAGIAAALLLLVPVIALTAASGLSMGRRSQHPRVRSKRMRMRFIGATGLLVLLPAAIFLYMRSSTGRFDTAFYLVQGIELIAGASNLILIGRNIGDGRALARERSARRGRAG